MFLSWLFKRKPPKIAIAAKPIAVNPSTPQRVKRNFMRIARLMRALEADPGAQNLRHEIARRKAALELGRVPLPKRSNMPDAWEQAAAQIKE